MSKVADRRNIDFLLDEVFNLEGLLENGKFQAYDRSDIAAILDLAQVIAENEFLPSAAELDRDEPRIEAGRVAIIPQVANALNASGKAGFFASNFPLEVGGLQLPFTIAMLINGILSCANLSVANYQVLTMANANMLNAFGTDEQKATFLGPMLEGRWFGTMCLSEPQAGSSLSDLLTNAAPTENGFYHLTGSKMWISGGEHELSENIIHMVLARTPGAPLGVKGLSLFIVPRYLVGANGTIGASNNVALAGLNHKMGQRGTSNCLLNFGEAGPTVGFLVGDLNKGLTYMFHMMNEARIMVGNGAVMSGYAGFLYSLDYARERSQGRHPAEKDARAPQVPIIEHADIKRMLLAQKAAVEGGLALILYCANLIDADDLSSSTDEKADIALLLDLLTPVAKSWPSEHCLEANKHAIQILGGYGYTRDYPVERFYRDNRLNHIHEGTYGIQGIDLLGRKVRVDGGRGLEVLRNKIRTTCDQAKSQGVLAEIAANLDRALTALAETTETVLACKDLKLGLANATLYLDAFGDVVVGWLWLEQASAAIRSLPTAGENDAAFYRGKVAACRYFHRYHLLSVEARFALVGSLDDTCVNLTSEEFIGH